MNELIARKYVKALLSTYKNTELDTLINSLSCISEAFKTKEFKDIIQSPQAQKAKKVELILSVAQNSDAKFTNLIKLLNEKDRLSLIPSIKKELESQVALANNVFEGSVVGDWDIEEAQIKKLEQGFSKQFDANIKLSSKKTDYPGLKISLDSLGVEASFSLQRLKAQIQEHILKAI